MSRAARNVPAPLPWEDVALAGWQNKYTILPTLGTVSTVVRTSDPSVYILTHTDAQAGGFYNLTVYALNGVAAIPLDAAGNLLEGKPDNQAAFQGRGTPIFNIGDGPLFADPFADGTSFSYAFKFAGRAYLGPNNENSGAFRFEPDGLNPTSVSFQGPAAPALCPLATSFGLTTSTSCASNWGPNGETGLVGFNSGTLSIGGTPYEILMVGPIKDNVSHLYFTQDVDTELNWTGCSLGSYTGGGNTKSVQNTYAFGGNIYAGISSSHNQQAPILIKIPTTVSGGVLSCSTGTDLDVRSLAYIGKNFANPANGIVGIDSMLMVPQATGTLNSASDTFYIANNGGVSRSNGTPTAVGSFTNVMNQTYLGSAAAGVADDITLVDDSLGKISPGRKGVPRMVVYKNTLFMARNVATSQALETTSNGGELWKCSTLCTTASNWTRVFTATPLGSNTGIEITKNKAISMLEVNGGYLYVGFDNMDDGARVYRTNVVPSGPAAFLEIGRVATAACTNHSGDTGALGGLCYGYQMLSSISIPKGSYNYLYLTAGCTLSTESADTKKCDGQAGAGFAPPAVRVLMQRD